MKLRYLILTLLLLALPVIVTAQPKLTDEEQQLIQQYYALFNQPAKEKEFYEVNRRVKETMQKREDRLGYYTFCINEVTYEINMHRNGKALKLAHEVLDEMRKNKDGRFDMIYNAMGTIYEDRGNYKMAKYYNQKAIDALTPNDTTGMIGAYLGMANLEASVHPDQTISLIDKTLTLCKNYPNHYSYAQVMKGLAYFFKSDAASFARLYNDYLAFKQENKVEDERNDSVMATIHAAFNRHFQDAIRLVGNKQFYSENMGYYDMVIQLYRLMGDKDMVILQQQRKLNAIDSLNANLIYENMNEMDAEMEVAKTQQAAARARIYWLVAVIILLLVAIGLLIARHLTRRRFQKQLLLQNEELEVALSRAEESDRMKTSFIEHVSHEIRTPLNIITGYAQIIANPDFELEEEDRNQILTSINDNTKAITDIINDLLEVAQDDSTDHYQRTDTVYVNTLCRKLVSDIERENHKQLELVFDSTLEDGFTFLTNETALNKVLTQLLKNAVKFTERGKVELYVHESPDHGVLRFIVTDTGIGIAEEHHERIFERFYKVDPFKQGFGLGLTMGRKIALLLGGSLEIDKTYSDGARFILTLPA